MVERTLAWMARYRRLFLVRYERRADTSEAFFLHLGCARICIEDTPE